LDTRRFDQLTRTLVAESPRRSLLAGLASGLLTAFAFSLHGITDIGANKNHKKHHKHKKKCKKTKCQPGQVCKSGQCVCTTASCAGCCAVGTCQPGNDPALCGTGGAACGTCAPGQVCPGNVCANGAIPVGDACVPAQSGACTSGVCGCNGMLCACRVTNCAAPGVGCVGSLDCCKGVCTGGFCSA
jgi:hypothetical protein